MPLAVLERLGAVLLGEAELRQLVDGVAHVGGRRVIRLLVVLLPGEG
jgi:hypothetical protein